VLLFIVQQNTHFPVKYPGVAVILAG